MQVEASHTSLVCACNLNLRQAKQARRLRQRQHKQRQNEPVKNYLKSQRKHKQQHNEMVKTIQAAKESRIAHLWAAREELCRHRQIAGEQPAMRLQARTCEERLRQPIQQTLSQNNTQAIYAGDDEQMAHLWAAREELCRHLQIAGNHPAMRLQAGMRQECYSLPA